MSEQSTAQPSRRSAVRIMVGMAWAALVASLGLGLGAVLRLISFGDGNAPVASVDFGLPTKDLASDAQVRGAVALMRDQGGFYALVLACPHLGCQPAWDRATRQYLCPCHGSRFAADGSLLRGPANKGLPHALLEMDNSGHLIAHPSRPVAAATRLKKG